MRGFTIIAAFVVGLTWALTLCWGVDADPEPNRILNPFRKNAKHGSGAPTEHNFYDKFEGNPVNAQRFSRKVDDEIAKERKGTGSGTRARKPVVYRSQRNKVVLEK